MKPNTIHGNSKFTVPHYRKKPDLIKIQGQKLRPIENTAKIPEKFRRISDMTSRTFQHVIRVHFTQITNQKDLANVIRKAYGFGTFNILFYSMTIKNKRYNPKFQCRTPDKCVYKLKGRCKVYKRHSEGWNCKANRKVICNFSPRAKITITPVSCLEIHEEDYSWKWHYGEHDKMHYFPWWKGTSFKDNQKNQSATGQEPISKDENWGF